MRRDDLAMRPREHEIIKMRKHWFVLLRESISTLILTILPFLAASFVAAAGLIDLEFFNSLPWVVLSSIWLLVCVMLLSTVWTNFILDIWLVSSRRIIHIEQFALFNREAVTIELVRVQNVSIETKGFFATLLHFGTIKVETAGAQTELIVFEGMPDPQMVKEVILKQARICAAEARSGLAHSN